MAQSVDQFKCLPVKLNSSSDVVRYLFLKKAEPPADSSILVANLPPFVDEGAIRRVFKRCGRIKQVVFGDSLDFGDFNSSRSKFFDPQPRHPSTACVTFDKVKSVEAALRLGGTETPILLYEDNEGPVTGVVRWQIDYNESFLNVDELQNEINEYMMNYDAQVEAELNEAKAKEGVPDEEGWITVNRHGKRPFIPNVEAIDEKILKKERKSTAIKPNFYSFQKNQTKLENLASLRAKFEEDKKRIAIMKASRKFKPV